MAKKSKGRPNHEVSSPHGSLVHPTFPPQGAPMPASGGSQSMTPGQMSPEGMSPTVDPSSIDQGGYGPGY